MKNIRRCAAPLFAALAVAGIAAAQDPPSRVARLSYMTGAVSFEPASVDEWAAASLNYPVSTGDNLYTDPNNARAVLRIGRNSIRLAPGTNFQMVQLTDQVVQASINSGAVSVRVKNLYQGETWEIDSPNGAITLTGPGEYRVDTDPNSNASMVTVRRGQCQVTSNNQSFVIDQGQTGYIDANNQPQIVSQNPNDAFDEFANARDRMEDVPPPSYVSADMSGYEDLGTYGSWQDSGDDYGQVWYPRVSAGWAPYQDGRWAWVEPWGWTWVDNSPWGFAPFHYGRWASISGRWGWLPGPVSVRPVYAPALVAFIGGSSWGVSFSLGGGSAVGWFPLGPREPYFPSYRVSNDYVRQVNISNTRITNVTVLNNVTNITNVTYVNQRVPGAVAAVSQTQFAGGGLVSRAIVRVQPNQLANARVVGVAAPVVPQRAAVLAGAVGVSAAARPPANIASRPVVSRLAPPPAVVPFAAKQQILQQHPGQPVAPQQLAQLRPAVAASQPNRIPAQRVVASQVRPITPTVSRAPIAAAPARPGVVAPPPSMGRPNNPSPMGQMNQPRPANAPPVAQPNAPRPGNVTPMGQMNQPRPANAPPVAQPNAPRPANAPPVTSRPAPQNAPPVQQPRPQALPLQQQRPQAVPPQPVTPSQQPRPQAAPSRQVAPPPQERPQEAPTRQTPPQEPRPQAVPPRQAAPPAQPPRPQAAPPRQTAPPQESRPQAAPPRQAAPPAQQPRPQHPAPAPKEPPKDEKPK